MQIAAGSRTLGLTLLFKARPWRFGIQPRILLVTFGLGSLFVAYVLFTATRQEARDRVHVHEQMRLVAAVASSRLDDHVGDVTQLLNVLSRTLGTDRTAIAANDALLQTVALQMPANLLSVSVWAADGANIGSTETFAAGGRPNAAEQAFFKSAWQAVGLKSEAPVQPRKGGLWTAIFAMPVMRDGKAVAVVSASSRLNSLAGLLSQDGDLPAGAIFSVINGDGRFLARSVDADRWIGKPSQLDRPQLLRRLAEGQGSAEFNGIDGTTRIFGYARLRSVPWLAYVGIPLDIALAPAHESSREGVFIGLAMLAAGLLIAAWVSGRIARPLRILSADARLLGEGHFEHRSAVRTSSEIGLLAHTFNRMAETLQERVAAVRQSEERLSLALEGSGHALFDWDIPGNRIFYSAKAAEMRGGAPQAIEVAPEEMRAYVHPDDLPDVLAALDAAVRGHTAVYETEFRVRHAGGHWIWLRGRGRVVERDAGGRALRLVGTDADITARKETENELRHRAEFDLLTGLPNRALFNERIAIAIERAERGGKGLALLFVDIDHFKVVNDTRGHEAGDELLKIAAVRLCGVVRTTDTVARLAGDEFTVILEGVASLADAQAVATKLVEVLRVPMRIRGASVVVSTSVGLAMYEPGERDPATLLRRADEALYEAKRRGRDRYAMRLVSAA